MLKSAIELCKEISPKHIEISAPHHYQSINKLKEVFEFYKKQEINFTLHNYFPPPEKSFVLNIASDNEEVLRSSKKLIEGALELCISSGSKIYGIHPGYLYRGAKANEEGMFVWENQSELSYDRALKQSVKIVNNYYHLFDRQNINFILENLFPRPKRKTSLFCSLEEIDEFLSYVPSDIGLLLDLGHLKISSNLYGFDLDDFLDKYLSKYGSKLYEIHISENNGIKDQHLPVKKDSWQLPVLDRIKSIKLDNGQERIYCLESRRANKTELIESLNLIEEAIS